MSGIITKDVVSGQRSKRRKGEMARKPKGDKTEFTSAGGLIWTILLLGLCCCLVNTFSLFYLHHYQDESSQQQPLLQQADVSGSKVRRSREELMAGKKRIIHILKQGGVDHLDDATLELLPTWQAVVDIYGNEPKIFGLDTCGTFQTTIPPSEAVLGVAGVFNSGTNLLAELLVANCHLSAREKKYGYKNKGIRWQVNWGKHQSPKWRLTHDVAEDNMVANENMLPVVSIRDPYLWMQSMCRHRYAAHWFHPPGHCPNLVANHIDYEFLKYAESGEYLYMEEYHHNDAWLKDNVLNMANFTSDQAIVPLYVKYNKETTNHVSLAHLWNDWYHEYTHGDFPKLIIRFEDLLFYGKEVTEKACKCAGGKMYPEFTHIGKSAKKGVIHGNDTTSLVDALIRYGKRQNVARGMTKDDIEYAKTAFADDLMKFFAYKHP